MRHTLTPRVLSFSPDLFTQSFVPWTKPLGPHCCGRNARNPECPRCSHLIPVNQGMLADVFFSTLSFYSSWMIDSLDSPVSTAVSCSLSRSTPSARPLLERSSSPSIIAPPNQGSLPPRKGEKSPDWKTEFDLSRLSYQTENTKLGSSYLGRWLTLLRYRQELPSYRTIVLHLFFYSPKWPLGKMVASARHCTPYPPTRGKYNKKNLQIFCRTKTDYRIARIVNFSLIPRGWGFGLQIHTYIHHYSLLPICWFKPNVPSYEHENFSIPQYIQRNKKAKRPGSHIILSAANYCFSFKSQEGRGLGSRYNTCMHIHACVLWNQMCARVDITKFLNPVAYILCTTTETTTWSKK